MTRAGDVGGAALRDRLSGGRELVRRHKLLRRIAVVLAVLVGLAVLIRVIVDPIATHYTRQGLSEAEGISADFQRVHVTLAPPGYEIRRLKLREGKRGGKREPLLYVETARVGLDWRELFRAHLTGSLTLDRPKVTVVRRASGKGEEPAKAAEEKPAEADEARAARKKKSSGISELEESLRQVIPLRVDRVDIVDGEFLLRDETIETTPELWVNRIDATLKNLATRQELAKGRAASLALSGRLGRSGALALKLSADPFATPLKFDGQFSLRDWKVVELYDILKAKADLQATQGTIGLYVKFKVRSGAISGKVKPVLEDVKLQSTSEDVGDRMKAWVSDKALQLSSGDDEKRAVGAEIPIQGRLDPDEALWPAVLEVVRNAFAEGIKVGVGDAVRQK
jgi:hypothetical protein